MTKYRSAKSQLKLTTSLMATVFVTTMPCGFTVAYAADAAEKNSIEEITVTAMRRQQTLMEVPQSVQAFSGVSLEFKGIKNLDKILTQIPGASQGFKTSSGTTEYNFRGTGGQGNLGDMAIGFYIDDVPYYTPDNPYAPAIRFFDLESVEVLRGPQGTLYGSGSMGGTIIVRTADPDLNDIHARARIKGATLKGGQANVGFDGTLDIPIVPGKMGLKFTGGYERVPGLAESPEFPGEKNIDDGSIWDIRSKLFIKPSDDVSIRMTYWDTNDKGNFTPTYFTNTPPTIIAGGLRGDRKNRTRLASLVVDGDTPVGTVKSSTSLNKYKDKVLFGVGVGGFAVFKVDLLAESTSFNQELTLTSKPGDFQWIMGGTYTKAKRTTHFTQDFSLLSPPTSLFNVSTITETETEQVAVFGEISQSLMDGLITPLVGLRYYRDNRSFNDADSNNDNVSHYDKVFSTFSPRFNLAIKASEDVRLYLNVAKGFRSGNFNPQAFVDLAELFGVNTNSANPSANLWAYEAGARLQFGDIEIEPAIYYNDYRDYQFAGIVGGVTVVSISLPKVKSVGADLVVRYKTPIEGLSLGFSGNLNKTTASGLSAELESQVSSLGRGQQLPYTPKWNYSVFANLATPISNNMDLIGYAAVTSSGSKLGSQDEISKPVTDISLRVGVKRDNWSVVLFGENLANELRPAAIRSSTTQTRRDPRTVGLEVTLGF